MRNFSISFLLTGIILSVVYKNNHDMSSGARFINHLYEFSHDTIRVDAKTFFLETFLLRENYVKEKENNEAQVNIMALIYLVDAKDLRIPTDIYISNLYVIDEGQLWRSSPTESQQTDTEFMLTKISAETPLMQESDYVDVIAEVTDTITRQTYFVIARHQHFSEL